MKIPNERTPPQQQEPITCIISGLLAAHIKDGAALSGLTPNQYVLSLLWHNVPLRQACPNALPDCVQLVLYDIYHHYVDAPYMGVQNPYEAAGMTREDFCGGTLPDDALLPDYVNEGDWVPMADNYNPEDLPF